MGTTFQEKPENAEALDRLREGLGQTRLGTLIPWSDIDRVGQIDHTTNRGRGVADRFRRWLFKSRGAVTRAVVGEGLRLLPHGENTMTTPEYRGRRSRSQLRRGINELRAVDREALSPHERRVHSEMLRRMREQRAEASQALHLLERARKPSESNPIPSRKKS